jgi:hemerythrin superfamily protein
VCPVTANTTVNATDLLLDEHRRIEGLFDRCMRAAGDERAQLARAIAAELRRHWRVEEEVFYPVLYRMRDDRARAAIRDALEQHHTIDGLLAGLETLEPDDARFEPRLVAVHEAFARHVRHEETTVFPHALENLAAPRLEKLAGQIRSRRR